MLLITVILISLCRQFLPQAPSSRRLRLLGPVGAIFFISLVLVAWRHVLAVDGFFGNTQSVKKTEHIFRQTPFESIVIYCQSSGCPFSRQIARRMAFEGFTDIKLYSKGWVDWISNDK